MFGALNLPLDSSYADQASLAVVQKAGVMSLDVLGSQQHTGAKQFGSDRTPMSTTDVSMSPVTPQNSNVGFGFSTGLSPMPSPCPFSPVMSPDAVQKSMQKSVQVGQNATSGNYAVKAERAPMCFASAGTPVAGVQALSPGTVIRQNAATFGIPLSLQPAAGELMIPIPVRTTSGHVVAPSPISRGTATAAAGAAADFMAAAARDSTGVQAVNAAGRLPTAGNRPFVTPFSAGLRGGA